MSWIQSIKERVWPRGPNLEGGGERVDIDHRRRPAFERFDMYQKSHFRRYEFAKKVLSGGERCGDFACGSGYGTVMLAEKFETALGVDLDADVLAEVRRRYQNVPNVNFVHCDLLKLNFRSEFDAIVSFETVEHLPEDSIPRLFSNFHRGLKPGGEIVFSVPFMQKKPVGGQDPGFHLTFLIDEKKIDRWLVDAGLELETFKYQNYATHLIEDTLEQRDFLICLARKD